MTDTPTPPDTDQDPNVSPEFQTEAAADLDTPAEPARTYFGMTVLQLGIVGVTAVGAIVIALVLVMHSSPPLRPQFVQTPEHRLVTTASAVPTWKAALNGNLDAAPNAALHITPHAAPAVHVEPVPPTSTVAPAPDALTRSAPPSPTPLAAGPELGPAALTALSTRLNALEQAVETQATELTHLQSAVHTAPAAPSVHEYQTLRAEMTRLSHDLRTLERQSRDLTTTLNARPIWPGWTVAAFTPYAAVLSGPNGAVQLVSPGETFAGVRVLSIDASHDKLVTSAGTLILKH